MSRNILVFGAGGALGTNFYSKLVKCIGTGSTTGGRSIQHLYGMDFKRENIDYTKLGGNFLQVDGMHFQTPDDHFDYLMENTKNVDQFDAVVCTAGGFIAGDLKKPEILSDTLGMLSCALVSSMVTARFAAHRVRPGGLVVLAGAAPVLEPGTTSWGIPYASSKAAVHQMVRDMGANPTMAGLNQGVKTIAYAPYILDTQFNRESMGKEADTSAWTPLDDLSEKMTQWVFEEESVDSGAIYKVVTKNGKTEFEKN